MSLYWLKRELFPRDSNAFASEDDGQIEKCRDMTKLKNHRIATLRSSRVLSLVNRHFWINVKFHSNFASMFIGYTDLIILYMPFIRTCISTYVHSFISCTLACHINATLFYHAVHPLEIRCEQVNVVRLSALHKRTPNYNWMKRILRILELSIKKVTQRVSHRRRVYMPYTICIRCAAVDTLMPATFTLPPPLPFPY